MGVWPIPCLIYADVMELEYMGDLKSPADCGLWVRLPSSAPAVVMIGFHLLLCVTVGQTTTAV